MSAAVSPASAKTYGVERVCAVWEQPRSSFYAWRLNHRGKVILPQRRTSEVRRLA